MITTWHFKKWHKQKNSFRSLKKKTFNSQPKVAFISLLQKKNQTKYKLRACLLFPWNMRNRYKLFVKRKTTWKSTMVYSLFPLVKSLDFSSVVLVAVAILCSFWCVAHHHYYYRAMYEMIVYLEWKQNCWIQTINTQTHTHVSVPHELRNMYTDGS